MIVLWILLGLLGLVFALIGLVLLLCCVSAGVRITNRYGKMLVRARFGVFRYTVTPRKELTEKQKAKKTARKKRKEEKKASKAAKKATKKKAAPSGKKKQKSKKPTPVVEKDIKLLLRCLLAALCDYDKEYLKLIKINDLEISYTVGGKDPYDIAVRYARASAALGLAFPPLMRLFRIKKHNLVVTPDFVARRTEFMYDITATLRPIKLLGSALTFWRAYRRNRTIYGEPKQKTVSNTVKTGNNTKQSEEKETCRTRTR